MRVDWLGAALLFGGVSALLIALGGDDRRRVAAVAGRWRPCCSPRFVFVERRVADPILPLDLLQTPLIARIARRGVPVGMAMFGAIAFIPLFVQGVMGGTATQAGQVLTPLFLGWVITSIVERTADGAASAIGRVAITGSVLMTLGFVGLAMVDADSPRTRLLAPCFVIGAGMGLSMLSLLLAVQHGVDRSHLGIATSLNQFSRSVGAAVGIAAMGAMLDARARRAFDMPGGVRRCRPARFASSGAGQAPVRRMRCSRVFVAGGVMSAVGLVVTFFLPRVDFSRGVPPAPASRCSPPR